MMKSKKFIEKLIDIAKNEKTLYIKGCFGARMTAANKARYTKNNPYNEKPERVKVIKAACEDTIGFDCVCLIKAVLWGFTGDKSKPYGGAAYRSNNVPDINADQMIAKCSAVSTNFSNIQPGEAVWMPGHIGVYIGDGLAVECTPKWKDKVQITACNCTKSGYYRRNWTKHGKLPYIDYTDQVKAVTPTVNTAAAKTTADKAKTQKTVVYTVKKGDTLSGIAKKYKTTVAKIAKENKITDVNKIIVGQKLKIPS